MNLIEKAKEFAHKAHDSIKQVRKYSGQPYWTHTDKVADVVASVLPNDAEAIAAAHLHDVLEDVWPVNQGYEYSERHIRDEFGQRVLDLVIALTDVYTKEAFGDLNRKQRKDLERERVAKIDPVAKTIKLADFLDNTSSIVEHDKDFSMVYIKEKLAMLPFLKEGHPELYQRCVMQTIIACDMLNIIPDETVPKL